MTPYQSREGAPVFLSDMILELGFAERSHVEAAVETARSSGETVGRILVREGRLTEDQLARALAARYGLCHIDLAEFDVDPGAANLLPPVAAQRYRAVAVEFEADGSLLVAMADPSDSLALNDIAFMTKLAVHAAVAADDLIAELVKRLPLPPSERRSSGYPTAPPAPAPAPPAAAPEAPLPSAFEPPPAVAQPAAPAPAPAAAAPAVDAGELTALRKELDATAAALDDERSKHAASVAKLREELAVERKRAEQEIGGAAAGDAGEELEQARAELERVRGKLSQKKEDLERARTDLQVRSDELEQAQGDLAQARSHAGDSEHSRQALERAQTELKAKGDELKQARDHLDEARSELERAGEDAERARKDLDKRNAELERAREELNEKGSELERARSDLGQKSSELTSARSELSQKSGELDHTRSELGQKSGDLERARTDLAAKGGELEQLRSELEHNRTEVERMRTELEQNRTTMAEALAERDTNLAELETARAEVERAGEALRRLDELEVAEARVHEAHTTVERMRNDFEIEREQHAATERDLRSLLASETARSEELQESQGSLQKRVDALRSQNAALLDAYATAKRWSAEFAKGARELADTLEQPVLDDAVGAQQTDERAKREAATRFAREEGEEPKGDDSSPPPEWLT